MTAAAVKIRKQPSMPEKLKQKVLSDNSLRLHSLLAGYNPISGHNAPGIRVAVTIDGFLGGKKMWVPIEMFKSRFFRVLVKYGSIRKYVSEKAPDEDPDKMFKATLRRLIRLRCKYDFYFFAGAYARIKNKEGGDDIPFYLRPAQVKLCRVFEKLRLAGAPIMVILLKCRQWGGSTLTDIYMAWIMIFWKTHWNCNIVGHQSTSSTNVFNMYEKLINALPLWLFYRTGERYPDDVKKIKNDAKNPNIKYLMPRSCQIQTGSALNPESARSSDVAMAHITEEAFFPNTEKWTPAQVVKSVVSPIGHNAYNFVVRESTPNGMENEYHEEWVRANSTDKEGRPLSSYTPVFVAWFEIETYVKPFKDDDERSDFAVWLWRHRNDETGNGRYFWHLYEIGASLEGINWYIEKLKDYSSIEDMQQEYPSDPIEAFKYSGRAVFDIYKVEQLREDCEDPIFVGDIEGDSFDPSVKCQPGEKPAKYEGYLCMQNLRLVQQTGGFLRVWEMPDDEVEMLHRYLVSVDIGGSHKTSDWTDIVVFDRHDVIYGGVPVVVAEWHGHCDPDQLAMKCAQIAHFYQNAFLVVENNTPYSRMNDTDGDVSELFFPILYPLYDNLYNSNHSRLLKHKPKEVKLGFNTNKSTKVAIIKFLAAVIRDRKYMEREADTLAEYAYFMQYPKGSNLQYGNAPGHHDDRVMARAIGLYVEHEMPVPEVVVRKSKDEIEREKLRRKKPVAPEIVGF